MPPWTYPAARLDDIVDDFHGTPVADPYRWLEDADSPDTQAWIAAQNALTETHLQGVPERVAIKERLTEVWDYPKYGVPFRRGGRMFYTYNDGLQNQAILYWKPEDGPAETLLDPNTWREDGTAALTNMAVTDSGKLLAYGISLSGSDWQELHARRVDSGEDFPDVIRWCKFTSIAWHPDETGFYYSRFPEPGTVPPEEQYQNQAVYFHRLGQPQAEDQKVYARPDNPHLGFLPEVSDDGCYLILTIYHGTDSETRIHYRNLDAPADAPFVPLLDEADASYSFVDNIGDRFYIRTDLEAEKGRLIAIDLPEPQQEQWLEIIPESEDTLSSVRLINDQLVAIYERDAHHIVNIYDLEGSFVREVALPEMGALTGLSGKRQDQDAYLGFSSFLYPPTIFHYDFDSGALKPYRIPELDFDAEGYETRQVFATSKDGTRVPVFLVHKKGLELDGNNPTLMYGYGGFQISMLPQFNVTRTVWLEAGGVYAVVNMRGGLEYGEAWHRAGMLGKKQNVFDDFIAAGEWLIENGITSQKRLAIYGGSNGGLLVAACMVQRPDLFGAVVCAVPVIDMLRFHKFTIGRYWTGEYGNAEENPEHFSFLMAYSPLHNIRQGATYPPALIVTADTDDRVDPAHARKFAAALQAADSGANPILIRVETRAGHGLGKPTSKQIEEQADIYAFLWRALDMSGKMKPA